MKLLICTQAIDLNHPILGFFHGWVMEFSKHFEEVHIITLQKGEYNFPSHVFVYSLGKEEGENDLKYALRFYKYFAHVFFKVKVSFVFFHMGSIYNVLGAPYFLIRKFFNTKFYWWKTHGTLTSLGKLALVFVDRVYTASSVSFPMETQKKHVVGHAIDIMDMPQRPYDESPLILFVGRITPVKKLEILLEMTNELRARGIIAPVRIVGVLPDRVYEAAVRSRIQELHLEEIVTIVGPKKYAELPLEFKRATVLVNPSETGGIDKVVLEAMMYGVPAVALAQTYGEILSPFGLSIEKQDAKAYADVVEKIIKDVSWRTSLQDGLRKEVVEHHALSTLPHRIFNI